MQTKVETKPVNIRITRTQADWLMDELRRIVSKQTETLTQTEPLPYPGKLIQASEQKAKALQLIDQIHSEL
jgi:hypothetical protein